MTKKGGGDGITLEQLVSLHERLMRREIRTAQRDFEAIRETLERVQPDTAFASERILTLARWTDAGCVDAERFLSALRRFDNARTPESVPVRDACALAISKIYEALLTSKPSVAAEELAWVHALVRNPENQPMRELELEFLEARIIGAWGKYESAADRLAKCADRAQQIGIPNAVVFIKTVEAAMNLQAGRLREGTLKDIHRLITDEDPLAKALLNNTWATLRRRQGLLHSAPAFWDAADKALGLCSFPPLVLIRKVKTGAALTQLRLLQDRRATRGPCDELDQLSRVVEAILPICQPNSHDRSTVLWAMGLVELQSDSWDSAIERAQQAYAEAPDHDNVAKARAKQLESQANLVKRAEQRDDDAGRNAITNAREALAHAQSTEHTRLITKSELQLADALSKGTDAERLVARQLLNVARRKIRPSVGDYLWGFILSIERDLGPSRDDALRVEELRADAVSGRKSLRQAREDFEDLVILDKAVELGSLGLALRYFRVGGPKRQRLMARLKARFDDARRRVKMRMAKASLSESVRTSDPDTTAGGSGEHGV